jgi:tRNA pseudouridine55 synthase
LNPSGLLVVIKPVGPTSHDVVHLVRKGTGERKVGHVGTLDPRASGVLVLCLGAATRLAEYLSGLDKGYRAVIRFGTATQTYDSEGPVSQHTGVSPGRDEIENALPSFLGEIQQTPPPFSAVRVGGRRAYDLARRGLALELEPRTVVVRRLEIEGYSPPDLRLVVECSSGTYIRSLAHDLGQRLGIGAYLAELVRTRVGPFSIERGVPLAELQAAFARGGWQGMIVPPAEALPHLPRVDLDPQAVARVFHGHRLPAAPGSRGLARAIDPQGQLVAILEAVDGGAAWHPRKVFVG